MRRILAIGLALLPALGCCHVAGHCDCDCAKGGDHYDAGLMAGAHNYAPQVAPAQNLTAVPVTASPANPGVTTLSPLPAGTMTVETTKEKLDMPKEGK